MVRLLIIVSIASFVLCVACFAVVAALGGGDLARHGWRWNWSHSHVWNDWDNIDDRRGRVDWSGPTITRDVAFTGARELEIDVPADVAFVQAPQGRLSITGPKDVVDNVSVDGGEIRLDKFDWRHFRHGQRLTIAVAGPDTRVFKIRGSQHLKIENYRQDSIDIELSGSGDVEASGVADRADVDVAGSGDVDLTRLALNHGKVELTGSGDVTLGPKQSADIDIEGSGDVRLLSRPPQLATDITGSGDVHTTDGQAIEAPTSGQSSGNAAP